MSTTSAEGSAGSTRSLRMELARDVRAPAIARAAVSERLVETGIDGSLGQTIVLLVSEVVSNAVRHSDGPTDAPIALAATIGDSAVRIAVTDAGNGFTPRPRDPERLGEGYGLYLVEKSASSWGVESDGGTTVWFELARSPASS
jgi:anti-sigma regulatory factor (Ser/Thr protein kinase)